MIKHLHHGPEHACLPQCGDPEHDVTHVGDGGVGYQFFQVLLRHGTKGAIEDTDHPEDSDGHGEIDRRLREDGIANPKQPVSPHLEEDPRQDHADRRGCLHMGIGEPGMKGPDGDLDGKADKEGSKDDQGELETEDGIGRLKLFVVRRHCDQIEGMMSINVRVEIHGQHGQEHEDRARKGIKKKFDRCILLPRSAPDPDEKIHGEEHEFPEDIKEEKVEGTENPDHSRLQEHHQGKVPFHLLLDPPGSHYGDKRDQRRQNQKGGRKAIDPHVVFNMEHGDPGVALHKGQ